MGAVRVGERFTVGSIFALTNSKLDFPDFPEFLSSVKRAT